ncbi:molybdopterin molybdotransferase MoeA [Marinospirillum insulare]|uniref:Molybdopterin molybdenumtransferase n=1 Tax=Marinospirillum insulare TaxID=217169 RepID=A0ABQ5ZZS5_9GAMM|nr:gephyrin-like molybdotransferase Glp [Marinospirillum insulare]GLR64171.1 molybdopterin molybdenumtransferase MoeA [Marinospirillum insulare]
MTSSPKLMPVAQALEKILEQITPLQESEQLTLLKADKRILAADLLAPINVPPADNSSMDGYALAYADRGQPLVISQRITAGASPSPLQAGTCARIFTGAEIPAGANTVVMQEEVTLDEQGRAIIPENLVSGQNVRPLGQDLKQGNLVLAAGTRLDYRHLGLLASLGLAKIAVLRRPKVALLASGDELVAAGEPLEPGQIYNSNQPLLTSLLEDLGAEVIQMERVADTFEATEQALLKASENADLILSTGGVSVGEEDHIKPVVEKIGKLGLWRIAMKPGKPLAFGEIKGVIFLGLPGNPVSTFIGAQIFLRPLLGKLSGSAAAQEEALFKGIANFTALTQVRQEYLRVKAKQVEGEWQLDAYPNQNSGVLSSVTWANALAVLPPGSNIQPGDSVNFIQIN